MKSTRICTASLLIIAFTCLIGFINSKGVARNSNNDLEGIYEYSAFYEIGNKAGTQTKNHRVTVNYYENAYGLSWGSLKVKATRVANGLIYEWKLGKAFGEGIYLFYQNNKKLFGTFRLTDENGEHWGYTQGVKIE